MSTDQDRPPAGHSKDHEHERPNSAESPRELLAVDDPSKQATVRGRQAAARGHGVAVQWVRPTDLAARIAARGAAGAVAAHVAVHRQARDSLRGRLAPASAFGRHGRVEQATVERSVVGR